MTKKSIGIISLLLVFLALGISFALFFTLKPQASGEAQNHTSSVSIEGYPLFFNKDRYGYVVASGRSGRQIYRFVTNRGFFLTVYLAFDLKGKVRKPILEVENLALIGRQGNIDFKKGATFNLLPVSESENQKHDTKKHQVRITIKEGLIWYQKDALKKIKYLQTPTSIVLQDALFLNT